MSVPEILVVFAKQFKATLLAFLMCFEAFAIHFHLRDLGVDVSTAIDPRMIVELAFVVIVNFLLKGPDHFIHDPGPAFMHCVVSVAVVGSWRLDRKSTRLNSSHT